MSTSPPPRDDAFTELVELHRAVLHVHCYRMLGSTHDADDALQETLLRAWRGAAGLRDTGSARAWLYTIATNVCITELGRRKRLLPQDYGPAAAPNTPPGAPVTEAAWIEPYPDQLLGVPTGRATPEASYEQREAVELAFVAALQHLAANQRAVLILREVLGFSAKEVAATMQTTVQAVNSSLQRARVAVQDRVPARSQQATLRTLGDHKLHELVGHYVDAWERCDVDAFAALLTEDATFAMPPLGTWYAPRDMIVSWARAFPLEGTWRWRTLITSANAQPAVAFYAWDDPNNAYLPFALNVLNVRDELVSNVTAFIVRAIKSAEPLTYADVAEQPTERQGLHGTFERFGLPDRLA